MTSNLQQSMSFVLQCILENISCDKNVQAEGLNSEKYKQASEDFRKECYSPICFIDLIYFC